LCQYSRRAQRPHCKSPPLAGRAAHHPVSRRGAFSRSVAGRTAAATLAGLRSLPIPPRQGGHVHASRAHFRPVLSPYQSADQALLTRRIGGGDSLIERARRSLGTSLRDSCRAARTRSARCGIGRCLVLMHHGVQIDTAHSIAEGRVHRATPDFGVANETACSVGSRDGAIRCPDLCKAVSAYEAPLRRIGRESA
jgi:hypothetical protein